MFFFGMHSPLLHRNSSISHFLYTEALRGFKVGYIVIRGNHELHRFKREKSFNRTETSVRIHGFAVMLGCYFGKKHLRACMLQGIY